MMRVFCPTEKCGMLANRLRFRHVFQRRSHFSKPYTRTQFLRMMEDQTEELNSLADKRARAHETMRAESRDMMLRASSDRERDEIRMTYQRRHSAIDSETEDRCGVLRCGGRHARVVVVLFKSLLYCGACRHINQTQLSMFFLSFLTTTHPLSQNFNN